MTKSVEHSFLYDLTHPADSALVQDLHDYFDWMYFAN